MVLCLGGSAVTRLQRPLYERDGVRSHDLPPGVHVPGHPSASHVHGFSRTGNTTYNGHNNIPDRVPKFSLLISTLPPTSSCWRPLRTSSVYPPASSCTSQTLRCLTTSGWWIWTAVRSVISVCPISHLLWRFIHFSSHECTDAPSQVVAPNNAEILPPLPEPEAAELKKHLKQVKTSVSFS